MDTVEVKLGSVYRDKIHGIKGVAVYKTLCLSGCNRVCLEYVKEGEIKEYWFDEPQLELVKKTKLKPPEDEKDKGGPGGTPPSRSTGIRR